MHLAEDEPRVRIHGDIEFSEDAEEFSEDKAALIEAFSNDVSMDSVDLGKRNAAIKGCDELGLQTFAFLKPRKGNEGGFFCRV